VEEGRGCEEDRERVCVGYIKGQEYNKNSGLRKWGFLLLRDCQVYLT
jgi:hypothetical protein